MNNWTLRAKLIGLLTVSLVALVLVGTRRMDRAGKYSGIVERNRQKPDAVGAWPWKLSTRRRRRRVQTTEIASQYENDYKAQEQFAEILKEREDNMAACR